MPFMGQEKTAPVALTDFESEQSRNRVKRGSGQNVLPKVGMKISTRSGLRSMLCNIS